MNAENSEKNISSLNVNRVTEEIRSGNHTHTSFEQINRYLDGSLTDAEREQVDDQLAECEQCLQLLMAAVDTAEHDLDAPSKENMDDFRGTEEKIEMNELRPALPDMKLLEQRVIAQLHSESEMQDNHSEDLTLTTNTVQEKPYRRSSWLQHPVTHYTIAASITLLLLGSGTFATFSQKIAEFDSNMIEQQRYPSAKPTTDKGQKESWSDKMVNQTSSWLDGLEAIRFK